MGKTIARVNTWVMMASLLGGLLLGASKPAGAVPIDQWASSVIGYSSTWAEWAWARNNPTYTGYTAQQALGAPNVFEYRENNKSWAALPRDNSLEFITLGFATPVFADSVTIRESLGNGFVYQVDAWDVFGLSHTVWAGVDPSKPGSVVDFLVDFGETTPYRVSALTIRVNTNTRIGVWEEIDAVQLHGRVPEGGTLVLLGLGLLGLVGFSRLSRQPQEMN